MARGRVSADKEQIAAIMACFLILACYFINAHDMTMALRHIPIDHIATIFLHRIKRVTIIYFKPHQYYLLFRKIAY